MASFRRSYSGYSRQAASRNADRCLQVAESATPNADISQQTPISPFQTGREAANTPYCRSMARQSSVVYPFAEHHALASAADPNPSPERIT